MDVERTLRQLERNPDDSDALAELFEAVWSNAEQLERFVEDVHVDGVHELRNDHPKWFTRHNVRMPYPLGVFEPRDVREVKRRLVDAAEQGLTSKPLGAAYNFSDTANTKDILLSMTEHINDVSPVTRDTLASHAESDLWRVDSGATVGRVNRRLWGHGRALLNQPGFEKLTFIGAACTGGHGSGIRIGPLCESVTSLRLATIDRTGDALEVQIEPSNGITDPQLHRTIHPQIPLHQDDSLFRAALVCSGTMGVVTEVVIRTQASYRLEERRTLRKWRKISGQLENLLADDSLHSVHVWVNPYDVENGNSCVLTTYHRTNDEPKGERGIGIRCGHLELAHRIIQILIQNNPRSIPNMLESALRATLPTSKKVVMDAPDALNFGGPNYFPAEAIDVGIDSSDTVSAVNDLLTLYKRLRDNDAQYVTAPIGLRFVGPSDAFLSPQFRRSTCMIEQPILRKTPGLRNTLARALDLLKDKYLGRPHWGQWNNLDHVDCARLYPEYDAFRRIRNDLDPRNVFRNSFTDRIGLTG